MKKTILSAAVTFFSICGTNIYAGTTGDAYGGIQYALGSYNEDGFEEVNPTALVGRFGKYVQNNFAIEGRIGIGLQDDSVNVFVPGFGNLDVSLDIDTLIGIYGVGHVNLNESSSVYALLGFTRGEATASGGGISISGDDSGLSYGVGANIGTGNNVSFNIEYTQYLNKSDFDLSAIGLGIVFGFD